MPPTRLGDSSRAQIAAVGASSGPAYKHKSIWSQTGQSLRLDTRFQSLRVIALPPRLPWGNLLQTMLVVQIAGIGLPPEGRCQSSRGAGQVRFASNATKFVAQHQPADRLRSSSIIRA